MAVVALLVPLLLLNMFLLEKPNNVVKFLAFITCCSYDLVFFFLPVSNYPFTIHAKFKVY
ncbi:hypothetical protein GLYMA_05G068101v4 [Glycine max]|nr:hypothetical protein GLYMA_05G068101v4 [Glycine max]KAH1133136.1 hypothetical protein GYH30_011815 [Glycine max]